ncbi:MAG: glycosyltransferase [Phycisphaeraceae bacterium]|nr:glycosyltransferase [Phycisphaeraceae bacterium]
MDTGPMITFAIPAHNEERLLPSTLAALHEAASGAGCPYEVVVADDASTDGTAAAARQGGARIVPIDRRQIAAARNAAARAGTGELLFFVDADTWINSEVLAQAMRAMERGAAGGGCPVRFDGVIPMWARPTLAATQLLFRMIRVSGGASMFCTRRAFEDGGGWNEDLFASEEMAFAKMIKRQGRFVLTRARVTTSGRKLRAYSGREIGREILRLVRHPRSSVRSREGLDIWYGPRREDPHDTTNRDPSA